MKKKLILLVLTIIFALCALCGCGEEKEIADKTPIDTRYTEAHTDFAMGMMYNGSTYVPYTYPVHRAELYEVYYHITYVDGSEKYKWVSVDKAEYERAKAILQEVNK